MGDYCPHEYTGEEMMLHYVFAWFGLLVIAMVNGALRDIAYKPYVGELYAHQISCVTGILLFALFIGFLAKRWPLPSSRQAWMIGFISPVDSET